MARFAFQIAAPFGGIIVVDEFDTPIPFVPDKARQLSENIIESVICGESRCVGVDVAPLRQTCDLLVQRGDLLGLLIQCPFVCVCGAMFFALPMLRQ